MNEIIFLQVTDDQFVSELEQAILQSKIDYEEKKDFYTKHDPEHSPQKLKQQHQAANKPLTVSLDEFNTLNTKQVQSTSEIRTCSNFGHMLSVRFKIASNRQKCPKTLCFVRFSDTNLCPKAEHDRSNVRISDIYPKCKGKCPKS